MILQYSIENVGYWLLFFKLLELVMSRSTSEHELLNMLRTNQSFHLLV